MFQQIETVAQIEPKMNIPQTIENVSGTKAGKKATAYTAAFTFVRLVSKPNRNDSRLLITPLLSRSNFPNSWRRAISV